ncbi:hypothetical protein WJN01_13365 [Flavobacteriaceae bacterium SZ-1-7]|uniref:hypothetical protein n=1 Tax=Tamlana sedimenti TaxID=3134126 RepID=UPI0031250D44
MKYFIPFVFSLLTFSCTTNSEKPKDDEMLLGRWKIIEQLIDPGDGSGTFQSIVSNRIFEFFTDGSVTVNGDMCYISTEVGDKTTGSYMETEESKWNDSEITPPDYSFEGIKVYYKIDGPNLILWYQCIEGCGQKFKKI